MFTAKMMTRLLHQAGTITALTSLTGILSACGNDPTTEMRFKAEIKLLNDNNLELVTTVTNHSNSSKILSDIDIDDKLHRSLNLSTASGASGEWMPIDNTYSYTINKSIQPGDSFTYTFLGTKSNDFITGDVDFVVNESFLNFRSIPISCCQ